MATKPSGAWWLAAACGLLMGAEASANPPEGASRLAGTRFVVVGHTYGVLKNRAQRQQLIDRVNAERVDYVFILGDADLWDPAVAEQYFSGIVVPVHSSPGNHDLEPGRREQYLENVGYLNQTVRARDADFVLINSSDDVVQINDYLETSLTEIDDSTPTILLTHHRIWDDNLLSDLPYGHDKSYRFGELHPQVRKKVDYVFAGNSPAQYFTNPYNPHVVYWSDVVWGIPCYSAGVAWSRNLTYLVAQVLGSELMITPRSASLSADSEEPMARTPRRRSSAAFRLLLVLRSRKFLAGVACGALASAAGLALWRRLASARALP